MEANWVGEVAQSPWAVLIMMGLVVLDAFLVVVPGETAVVALAAASASAGLPTIGVIAAGAWVSALVGDCACYLVGRGAVSTGGGGSVGPRCVERCTVCGR